MTEREFLRIIETVDLQLGNEGVQAIARPLWACVRFPCPNKLIGSYPEDPSFGPYEGPNLQYRIHEWYQEHYGTLTTLPKTRQQRLILVRGQLFKINIPMVFNAFNTLNVFEHIPEMPAEFREMLTPADREEIQQSFNVFYRQTSDTELCRIRVRGCADKTSCYSLLCAGWSDLTTCGQAFSPQDPGASLFPAQQATEKYLKAMLLFSDPGLSDDALKRKYGHKIARLAEECSKIDVRLSQFLPHAHMLDFGQEVRYKRPHLELVEIVDRVNLSHGTCHLVALSLLSTFSKQKPNQTV